MKIIALLLGNFIGFWKRNKGNTNGVCDFLSKYFAFFFAFTFPGVLLCIEKYFEINCFTKYTEIFRVSLFELERYNLCLSVIVPFIVAYLVANICLRHNDLYKKLGDQYDYNDKKIGLLFILCPFLALSIILILLFLK